jgi:hypothetical protein
MPDAPPYIILVRKKQLLLNMLRLRAVVNNHDIYELETNVPVAIPCTDPVTTLVVSNGFHLSKPLRFPGNWKGVVTLEVDCEFDDVRLFYVVFLSLVLFGVGYATGYWQVKIIANLPALYFLYSFYIRKGKFIVIRPYGAPVSALDIEREE